MEGLLRALLAWQAHPTAKPPALAVLRVSYKARTSATKDGPCYNYKTIFSSHLRFAHFVTFKPLWMMMTCRNQVIITKPGHKYVYVGVGGEVWKG